MEAKVTGFTSTGMGVAIYVGSTAWFLFLVGLDIGYIYTGERTELYGMILTGNVLMFTLQTFNVLNLLFKFWGIVSLYYTLQIWTIALRAVILATDMDNVWPQSLILLAQCLFTGSQFSVTLEYLYRVAYQVQARPWITEPTKPVRPGPSARV